MLTRDRGFEAGEYKMQVRTADGTDLGSPASITLKGENPVVDRRTIAFNAKDPKIKKVDGADAGAAVAKNDPNTAGPTTGNGEVTPVGSAAPFIPQDAYEKTPEETLKEKPGGCGCVVAGQDMGGTGALALSAALALLVLARRRRG
jgi:MYXO-CTERM domain-containing protein